MLCGWGKAKEGPAVKWLVSHALIISFIHSKPFPWAPTVWQAPSRVQGIKL